MENSLTGFKIKYLCPTNFRGARIRVTQLNTGEGRIIDRDYSKDPLDQVTDTLDNLKIKWSVLIDNKIDHTTIIVPFCSQLDQVLGELK